MGESVHIESFHLEHVRLAVRLAVPRPAACCAPAVHIASGSGFEASLSISSTHLLTRSFTHLPIHSFSCPFIHSIVVWVSRS